MALHIPSSMRVFLLVFLGLNLLQSGSTPLLYDEAYFWYYAQNPSLGFFEYPPMIAWMIWVGERLFEGELGVRLLSTLMGSGTALFLWLSQERPEKQDPRLFALLFCAFPLLHLYTFLSLPNSALLFFSAWGFYAFKCYSVHKDIFNTVFFGVSMAGILYSEYLGIFLIAVFPFARPAMVRESAYWKAMGLCLGLYLPHLIWLGLNDWVSIRYTFFERPLPLREPLAFTSGTLLKLTLVLGLMTPFVYKGLLKWSRENIISKAAFYLSCTLLVFYFLSSFQRPVSLQLLALFSLPALLLTAAFLTESTVWRKWIWPLAGGQVILLLYFRIALVIPQISLFPHPAHHIESWVEIMKSRSDSLPLVFENNPQKAALFSFYTDQSSYSFNTFNFRKNQYNLDTLTEARLRGERVSYVNEKDPLAQDFTIKDTVYGKLPVQDPFYSYRNLEAWLDTDEVVSQNIGARKLLVFNPYSDSIPIGQLNIRVAFRDKNRRILGTIPAPYLPMPKFSDEGIPLDQTYLKRMDTTEFRITLPLEAPTEARYLQIALSEFGQLPGLNSRPIRLKLEEKEE